MNEKQLYKQKVWEFLDQVSAGETYTVESMCKPANRELFIQAIKEYMDAHEWQGWFCFNKDYTKFYKTNEITFKESPKSEVRSPELMNNE